MIVAQPSQHVKPSTPIYGGQLDVIRHQLRVVMAVDNRTQFLYPCRGDEVDIAGKVSQ